MSNIDCDSCGGYDLDPDVQGYITSKHKADCIGDPEVWEPTRWWRVLNEKGGLQAESSNEKEIRGFAKKQPGWTVQRHMRYTTERWENA